jgi:glutamate synthase (NADPH/NADH) small chain
MEKWVIDRRIDVMAAEGVRFVTGVNVGVDLTAEDIAADQDAVVISTGAAVPRDLPIPGRDLAGIHFAMPYLCQQNRRVAGENPLVGAAGEITAAGKHVIIIGGGDTGSDCVGTALRQGAASVTSFELLPRPSEDRPAHQPWPYWPMRLRTSSSHEEGGQREWQILAKAFSGDRGRVRQVDTIALRWGTPKGGAPAFKELHGTEKTWPADLVLLAMGFLGPEPDTIVNQYGLDLDDRGNIRTGDDYMSSVPGVFAAGDARRGQSLVVWAISEGREAARCVDRYLMGHSDLPTKGEGDLPRVP